MILLLVALILFTIVVAGAAFMVTHVFLLYFCITFVLVFLGVL